MSRPTEAKVIAVGIGHPPNILPVQRRPGSQIQWHTIDCPVAVAYHEGRTPDARCLAHPLKNGCASLPRPRDQEDQA